ncbi:MAG: bifunctional phosphoribosylaminoimidazolecarboxamide formyltransferase/IMP cyclohydrolase [Verrucomicrobiales bacterium]|jgi:phosphoribosylaminoimidazolecarboxamide formyltransferase/IMP cyclohydrolase|nr:bifunctional phosphoribosylaminoimidazolecarboxamide formyltransferase/IMP cyclohydrolase [Verrucomicrobiales bacterium]
MIKNALLSVSDKTGLLDFARFLVAKQVRLISTGGTAKLLRDAGLPVQEISDYTGFPEMMDGRVKTLHPKVHGGLLHLRDNPEHVRQANAHHIEPIDLVVVNLYPFEQTLAKPGVSHEELIEHIDIGGPSMLRSASKNYRSVTVIVDPADYAKAQAEIAADGDTAPATREQLAAKVFRHTARYDSLIANYLTVRATPATPLLQESLTLSGRRAQPLRYGENPIQQAALYGDFHRHFHQIHGKELSYNNIIDISAAVNLIGEFDTLTLAILKHTNPCGVGGGDDLRAAWERAFATDRQAPYGGIIVMNRALDLPVAAAIAEIFSEVIIAPAFADDAKALLMKKKNLRLIENHWQRAGGRYDAHSVLGGFVAQASDDAPDDETQWQVVTRRQPTVSELAALRFGWKVVKHVKSNAIVYAADGQTLGIGAGQMSRVDSSKIAVWKAGEAKLSLRGSIIASDAFFPFADGIQAAADAGATAAIEPGGSVRDAEVIAAADAANMAMIFTGRRHFRH